MWPSIKNNLQQGFTLIEVLVAMSIFLIVALLASQSLSNSFQSKQIIDQHLIELETQQKAVALLRQDLSQCIDRPVNSAAGEHLPAFQGASTQLAFTRTGVMDLSRPSSRSHLRRIQYRLKHDKLERIEWQALDRTEKTPYLKQPLLEGLQQIEFLFIDHEGKRKNSWATKAIPEQPLPNLVKVTLRFHDHKKLQLSIALPSEGGQFE